MAAPRKAAVAEEGRPAPFLDLNSRDSQMDFVYGDKTYYILSADELSIVAQETLSRFYIKIKEVGEWEGDDDGLLSESQQTAIEDLEFKLLRTIVPDAPESDLRAIPPHLRKRVTDAFTKEVDQEPFLMRLLKKVMTNRVDRMAANVTPMRQNSAPGNGTDTSSEKSADTPQDSPHAATAP